MATNNADIMELLKKLGIGAGLGQLGGGIAGMFGGGGKSPADAANQYYNQIPGATNPYFQPFINQGNQTGQGLQNTYGGLVNNPGEMFSNLGKGYKESPGYQFKLQQGLGAAGNAAASGGMLGTPLHQQNATQVANDIASQDFNDYMKNIMGLFGQGLQGQENTVNRGFNAGREYGGILGNNLSNQGANAYEDQAAQNKSGGQNWSNIIGGLAGMLPFLI